MGGRPLMPVSRTVPALLDELAKRHPHVEFVIDNERRLTYTQMRDEARRLARGLYAMGVRRGDKVAILMGNRAEWIVADLAILALGATMVSLNTWAAPRELEYMLEHSDTSTLICVDRFLGSDYVEMLSVIGAGAGGLPKLERVIRVDPQPRPLAGSVSWNEVLQAAASVPESKLDACQARVVPRDVAYILYTSGSTATPKGVQLQHFALVENMWHIGERQHLVVGDRLWLAVSLFWAFGCVNPLFALMTHGGTLVLQEHFEPAGAIALIERERCSVIYATPNMVRAICEHPDYRPGAFASLRTGATIGTPEQVRLLAGMGAAQICNVYGLTETYGNCAVTDAGWPLERRANCMGEPLPGVEVRIVDVTSRESLPAGETGEILVRGYVTCGYYKDEEKNREAFDGEGFFLSGDMGFLDPAGRVHFQGRLKELIKTGGINVGPMEVEAVLMSHPGVEQAFVVGVPDAQRDEIVAAVVVARKDSPPSEDELRAHCAQALAAYKRPRRYLLITAGELPLTTTGKVRKAAMPAMFEHCA